MSYESQYYDDLQKAPGNDSIRIKSFAVSSDNGSLQIDIESGILFKIEFMCYKQSAMLDINIEVKTMDDITVFQVGNVLGEVGEKDSKRGLYEAKFRVAPYTLNAGKYKAVVFFGENQRYLVLGGIEQCFIVENTISDMGFNQNAQPGYLRLRNNIEISYKG